jgi:hypothetical protein
VTLLELTYQRGKAQREARELLDRATLEARNLTITEQVRFDTLLARVPELDAALEARAALRRMA